MRINERKGEEGDNMEDGRAKSDEKMRKWLKTGTNLSFFTPSVL